jgi:hypothetical protein
LKLTTLLFEETGKHNTQATLEIARERAVALGIKQIVLASTKGDTARQAHALFGPEGIQLVVISINHSWERDGWTIPPETKAQLQELGVVVYTGIHALGGVSSAFTAKYGGRSLEEMIRDVLYRFSQGMKVAVECVLMAADAGLINVEQEVIAIGGTSRGADTAIVCKPAYSSAFLDLEIREVLAKPRVP